MIKQMKNTYRCYRLCKVIDKNLGMHDCDDKSCEARGQYGAEINAKYKRIALGALSRMVGRGLLKRKEFKIDENTDKFLWHKVSKVRRYQKYAEGRGYIEPISCTKGKKLVGITDKGIDLLDNWSPLIPSGLIKQLIKDNRVLFSLVISTLYLWSQGVTINGLIKALSDKIGL